MTPTAWLTAYEYLNTQLNCLAAQLLAIAHVLSSTYSLHIAIYILHSTLCKLYIC